MRQHRARCAERLLSAALPYGCSWPDRSRKALRSRSHYSSLAPAATLTGNRLTAGANGQIANGFTAQYGLKALLKSRVVRPFFGIGADRNRPPPYVSIPLVPS